MHVRLLQQCQCQCQCHLSLLLHLLLFLQSHLRLVVMLSLRQACVRATPWLVGAGRTPAVTSKVAFVSARAVSSTAWIAAPVPHPVQAGNSCEIFNRLALTPSADVAWGAALCQLPTVDAVRMYHPAKKGRPGGPKRSAKKPTYNNNEHRHKPKWPKFNNAVTANTVRVLDAAGEQIGVMPRASALSYAKERHLDLVQFSDMNEPVVCKVMDWHKEQRAMRQRANARKREAAQREREASNKKMKRMQFTARIEDHDLHVKTMKMQRMLEKGHGIKVTIAFQVRLMCVCVCPRGFSESALRMGAPLLSVPGP